MRSSQGIAAIVFVVFCLPFSTNVFAQCDDWRAGPLIEMAGVDGTVLAATSWDPDGAGPFAPQLVVGGFFTAAGGASASDVATWDGLSWQAIGGGIRRTDQYISYVESLAVLPDSLGAIGGQLVAGGFFNQAGGLAIAGIARWDGTTWHSMSGLTYQGNSDLQVQQLAIMPANAGSLAGQLIAIAGCGSAGGEPVNNGMARWDGAAWHAIGPSPTRYTPFSMTNWDPDGAGPQGPELVVGFMDADSERAVVSAWNGSAWQPFGPVIYDYGAVVLSLGTMPSGPYAGQLIAGTNRNGGVLRWDGAAWQQFGPISDHNAYFSPFALSAIPTGNGAFGGQLALGGYFDDNFSGVTLSYIARHDGTAWQPVGTGFDAQVNTLTAWDPDGAGSQSPQLVAGGWFRNAGSSVVNGVARFDGTTWRPFSGSVPAAQIFAMGQFGSKLVAGGSFSFTTPASYTPNNIAVWDGRSITTLGSGMNAPVRALKGYTTGSGIGQTYHLVAGGEFTTAGGTPANRIAIWSEGVNGNIQPWAALGNGLNNRVNAVERYANATIVGGQFTASGSTTLNRIAVYTSNNWLALGSGLNGPCNALKVYDNQLYVGGTFTIAGGLSSVGLARLNGTTWTSMGNINGTVNALEVYGGDLILGGNFPGVSGSPNIIKFNSTHGTFAPLGTGTSGTVYSLLSEGGYLYVGGAFTQAGGASHNHMARWDGTSWSDVRGGTDGTVYSMFGFHNEVHAGGNFDNVRNGAVNSSGWARYLETGAPWIVQNPSSDSEVCCDSASFSALAAAGYGGLSFQWRRNGAPLVDGPTGTGSTVAGAHNATVDIRDVSVADAGTYDLVLSNSCGSDTSIAATLSITGGTGNGDGNGDGFVDGQDIPGFVTMVTTGVSQGRGVCAYDMNGDGVVNTIDLPPFVARLLN